MWLRFENYVCQNERIWESGVGVGGVLRSPSRICHWSNSLFGISPDQYKKEDVARTLLNMICGNLVQVCLNNAVVSGIRHIFVAGSFISHPLTQKIVLAEFETQRCQMAGQVLNRVRL